MKSILTFAVLTMVTAALSGHSRTPSATEIWLSLSIGSFALGAASFLALAFDAPPIRWRVSRGKMLASLAAAVVMAPVAAAVAGVTAVLAIPAIILALLFMPALFWREHHIEAGPGHHHGPLGLHIRPAHHA